MLPYQADRTSLAKISSTDLFGQVVIWNLSGKVSLTYSLIEYRHEFYLIFFVENKKMNDLQLTNMK